MNTLLSPLSLLPAAALLTVAFTASSASAATLTVCSSGCDYSNLEVAVDDSSAGDVLELGNQTFVGGLDIKHDLTLRPIGAGMPVIDGGTLNNVVRVRPDVSVTLESVEITGGTIKSGIKNSGTLVLDEVYVLGNDCTYGGLWNLGTLIVLGNSVFSGNSSTSFFSGAITNFGGDVDISNTTFLSNDGYNGGAVSNLSGEMSIYATSFTANSGYLGGALHNSWGDLEIDTSSFSTNSATSIGGGWSNHNIGGTVTTTNVGYAANATGSGTYESCYDVNGPC